MQDPTTIRPKLKKSAIVLPTEDGLYFQGDKATFRLKGKSLVRLMSTLSPYLTGAYTLADLCDRLDAAHRHTVVSLVETLLQRGVLKNALPEPPDLLPGEVLTAFQSQIEFIDHYADNARTRFKAFRESRILLLGSGEMFTFLARSLMRNGLRQCFLAPSIDAEICLEEVQSEAELLRQAGCAIDISLLPPNVDLKEYDFVVYAADSESLRTALVLNERCIHDARPFLAATIFGGRAMIGPLARSSTDPCWLCAQLRLSANMQPDNSAALWRELALGDSLSHLQSTLFAPVARRIANGLAFELFKLLSGALPSETEGGVILQELDTLEAYRAKLVRHPLCPLCVQRSSNEAASQSRDAQGPQVIPGSVASPNVLWAPRSQGEMKPSPNGAADCEGVSLIAQRQLEEILTGERDRDLKEVDLSQKTSLLLDPHLGIFSIFADGHLPQLPLKVSTVSVGHPTSPTLGRLDTTAFSIENIQIARHAALKAALLKYSQALPDSRSMRTTTRKQLLAEGLDAIDPRKLATWSGHAPALDARPIPWMLAASPLTERRCYVPAAAVYPHSSLNQFALFERTSAGWAVAPTFHQVLTTGILSALAYTSIKDMLHGRKALSQLAIEDLPSSDPDLAFLIRSAQRFNRPFTLREITPASPISVCIAHTTDEAQEIAIGIGLTQPEAAKNALLEFVGRLQLTQAGNDLTSLAPPLFLGLSSLIAALSKQPGHAHSKSPATHTSYEEPIQVSLPGAEGHLADLSAHLRQINQDVLFVHTTPSDIWETEAFICGVVLPLQS